MEKDIKQVFCKKCGGLKSLRIEGKKVSAEDWMKYGMACDIGCICKAILKG